MQVALDLVVPLRGCSYGRTDRRRRIRRSDEEQREGRDQRDQHDTQRADQAARHEIEHGAFLLTDEGGDRTVGPVTTLSFRAERVAQVFDQGCLM